MSVCRENEKAEFGTQYSEFRIQKKIGKLIFKVAVKKRCEMPECRHRGIPALWSNAF
jgi:hypothetical protein